MDNDYYENSLPVHKLSYCAFLDILGFSANISESYKNETSNQLLGIFHSIFSEQVEKIKKEREDSLLYFKSFSDNVLLAVPQFSYDMESEFGSILWPIKEYQFAMALRGYFIRGGLSVGPLFIDDNHVYGGALIEAYKLESKIAVNPMVVLCDNTMELVDHHMTYYSKDWAPQLDAVLVNHDGRYFINYLSECVYETFNGYELDTSSLETHRDKITEALLKHSNNPQVFSKYVWLSTYHNYFCESVSEFPNYSKELKVDTTHSEIHFSRLDEK